MSTALLTGGTSQLGRLVTDQLLRRGMDVRAVVRGEGARYDVHKARGSAELSFLYRDLCNPEIRLNQNDLRDVSTIIHLARPRHHEGSARSGGRKMLQNVLKAARQLGPSLSRAVVLSTTQVAGDYQSRFYEDWLDVGQTFSSERARAAYDLECQARAHRPELPLVIVRHAPLVGHSVTGEAECDAVLGWLFSLGAMISKLPGQLRPPVPAQGPRFVTVSPVDYVAAGLAFVATTKNTLHPATTLCLADADPPTLSELSQIILDRLGGPKGGFRIPFDGKGPLGMTLHMAARAGAWVSRLAKTESQLTQAFFRRGDHDVSNALRLLSPQGIECPKLATYLDALYSDYLDRHKRSSS